MATHMFSAPQFKHALLACILALGVFGCTKKEKKTRPSIPDPPNANRIIITDELVLKMELDVPGQDTQAMLFPKESRPKDEAEKLLEDQKAKKRRVIALALAKKSAKSNVAVKPKLAKKRLVKVASNTKEAPEVESDADTLISCEVLDNPSEEAVLSGVGALKAKKKVPSKVAVAIEEEEVLSEVPLKKLKLKPSSKTFLKRTVNRHSYLKKTKSSSPKSPALLGSPLSP